MVSDDDLVDRFAQFLPEGERLAPRTFSNLRKKYGDPEDEFGIKLLDEFGVAQCLSLAAFADSDPAVEIQITFLSGPAGQEFPTLEPGEILLKDYLVADDSTSEV